PPSSRRRVRADPLGPARARLRGAARRVRGSRPARRRAPGSALRRRKALDQDLHSLGRESSRPPMLRQIEHKIESLFEGIFGRAFRTHVQPVELARKLAKEMDDGKTVSVSRVYVPNEYSIYLAPDDRRQFDSYEASLVDELQPYLAEHARREEYALLSTPRVVFHTDEDLAVGEFGIATRMVQPPGAAKAKDGPPSATMIYRPTRQP